ncbi:MAG: hypothetical protein SF187_01750 [Deltaproteobacteria bacterium]|nr:hypothetical protein [Deltaproteobacteria bacterium]
MAATFGFGEARAADLGISPPSNRLFVSGEAAAGGMVRSQVALGYGRPHQAWSGAEVWGLTFSTFGSVGASLRGKLPFIDANIGIRQTWAYQFGRLPPEEHHRGVDDSGAQNRYVAIDAGVTLYAPAPYGYAFVWADLTLPDIPNDAHIYEEHLRAIVGRGASWAVRPTYLFATNESRLSFGPMLEYVRLGGRRAGMWRVGGCVFYELSKRWDFGLVLTGAVSGPDELSLWDGMWGTGRFRYRWSL